MKSIITGRRTPVRAAVLGASLLAAAALPAHTATAYAATEGVELTYEEPTLESGKVTWEWTVSNTDDGDVDKVVLTHKVTFKAKGGSKAKDGDEPAETNLTVRPVDKPCEVRPESVRCDYGMLEAGGTRSGKLVAEIPKNASGTAEIAGQVSWTSKRGEGEPDAQDVEGKPTDEAAPEGPLDPPGIMTP